MGLIFKGKDNKTILIEALTVSLDEVETTLYDLALNEVANIYGNCLSQMEFDFFSKNKLATQQELDYKFNVKPNVNQNKSAFFKEVAKRLVLDNQVLIVKHKDNWFIAKDFDKKITNDNFVYFEDIKITDDIKVKNKLKINDVLFFELNNDNVARISKNVSQLYGKQFKKIINRYKNRRGIFAIDNFQAFKDKEQEDVKELFKKKVSDYFGSSDAAAMTTEKGIEFKDNSENTISFEEIDRIIKRIYEDVFNAYLIDINILRSANVSSTKNANSALDKALILAVKPIVELIESEMKSKFYTMKDYFEGNFVKININKIKANSLLDEASNIDILIRNGFTMNEILKDMGKPQINDEWANKRHITKNYEAL